jgi:hypothetical protein
MLGSIARLRRTLPTVGLLLAGALVLTSCGGGDDGGSDSLPVPDAATEVSATDMSGEEAAGLLFLDPGGELTAVGDVSVRQYDVASAIDTVVAFYDAPAGGWESAFTTAFEDARLLIWEREDQTAWISIVPGASADETSLTVIVSS